MKLSIFHSLVPLMLWMVLGGPAAAGPGAHGPNGEHMDSPSQQAVTGSAQAPRLDAKSELFELVAQLSGGELSLLIDRFATNEPVLNAAVEVASGTLKARASFHADGGDYAVVDPALLKLLATPGEHALVITVIAGEDSDLLDGVLRVGAAPAGIDFGHDHGPDHGNSLRAWLPWAAGAAVALALLAGWRWRTSARRAAASAGSPA